MKGILKHTTAGWFVMYSVMRDEITSGYDSLPLHQETFDPTTKQPIIPLEDGKQVEFEMVNYDGNTKMSEGWIGYAKLIATKEQTNGERFDDFMRTIEGYPELEGIMNLCEDIIEKKTGKMTEEEWQAAESAQTEPKDVVLGYKTSLEAQMLDSKLPKQENCCTPIG
jgi:hypothetical protein